MPESEPTLAKSEATLIKTRVDISFVVVAMGIPVTASHVFSEMLLEDSTMMSMARLLKTLYGATGCATSLYMTALVKLDIVES